jgi:hypothetical protein
MADDIVAIFDDFLKRKRIAAEPQLQPASP